MVSIVNYDQYRGYSDYLLPLERLNWKVFGTLTFRDKSKRKSTPRSTSLRNDDFSRLLDNSFYKLNINHELVPYFCRHEESVQDAWHIHFIIAECKALRALSAKAICAELNASWHRDFRGVRGINGTSHIEPFNAEMPGLKYICKLDKYKKNADNGWVEYFIPSESLKRLIQETHIGNQDVSFQNDGQCSANIQTSRQDMDDMCNTRSDTRYSQTIS